MFKSLHILAILNVPNTLESKQSCLSFSQPSVFTYPAACIIILGFSFLIVLYNVL